MRASVWILAVWALCAGCATQKSLYQWGHYEDSLYRMYKHPEKAKEYQEALRLIIQRCEKAGRIVPPGIYAEYGYSLYKEGRFEEAAAFFKKEREAWPESYVLMNTLITNVEKLKASRDAAGEEAPSETPQPAAED